MYDPRLARWMGRWIAPAIPYKVRGCVTFGCAYAQPRASPRPPPVTHRPRRSAWLRHFSHPGAIPPWSGCSRTPTPVSQRAASSGMSALPAFWSFWRHLRPVAARAVCTRHRSGSLPRVSGPSWKLRHRRSVWRVSPCRESRGVRGRNCAQRTSAPVWTKGTVRSTQHQVNARLPALRCGIRGSRLERAGLPRNVKHKVELVCSRYTRSAYVFNCSIRPLYGTDSLREPAA